MGKAVPDSLFGLFPDRTGVQKHNIRQRDIGCGIITLLREDGSDNLTIGKIHLAAVTFYIQLPAFPCIHLLRYMKCLTRLSRFISQNSDVLNQICHNSPMSLQKYNKWE